MLGHERVWLIRDAGFTEDPWGQEERGLSAGSQQGGDGSSQETRGDRSWEQGGGSGSVSGASQSYKEVKPWTLGGQGSRKMAQGAAWCSEAPFTPALPSARMPSPSLLPERSLHPSRSGLSF